MLLFKNAPVLFAILSHIAVAFTMFLITIPIFASDNNSKISENSIMSFRSADKKTGINEVSKSFSIPSWTLRNQIFVVNLKVL